MSAEPAVLNSSERPSRALVRTTPWTTVIVLGVLLAWVDGYIMVTLRGAVGYIGRTQGPFATWMLDSAMYLPLFLVAVWAAVVVARRWSRGRHPLAATALLVAATTAVLGVLLTAANAVYDYQLQTQQMMTMMQTVPNMAAGMQATLTESAEVQAEAVGVVSVVLLVANLVVVGWVTALRGGRLLR